MDNRSVVSIIIPTFNVEKYITEMIKSIIRQTYTNWELIIVDDGSTDNTYNLIEEYAKTDNRIILLKRNREPKGSLTCRNIGQEKATGKYFIHFDSDDIVEPFCLEQRLKFMDAHPELEYATFKGKTITQNRDGVIYDSGKYWGIDPKSDLLSCFLSTEYPYSVWNNIYRASAFINYYWDENVRIYTDFSYIVPAIISGKRHSFDTGSKPDYLYRRGQNDAMTSNFISWDKYQSTKYLFRKTMNQLKNTEEYDKYKKNFKKFFVLQYQRIIENGSIEQLEDYNKFFRTYYPKGQINISLAYRLFRRFKSKNQGVKSRKAKLFLYLFLSPKTIYRWSIMQIRTVFKLW